MIRLIRNEFLKLHRRHFFLVSFVIVSLALSIYTGVYYFMADNRTDQDIVEQQLEKEKAYMAQIESIQWDTELEMQSAILSSQATIDRLQYMVDHKIAVWDWRSDVLSRYYTNQNIISLLNAGQDPKDYGFTDSSGSYDSKATWIQRLTNQCDVQMRMVEENDYMTYSQEQLGLLQTQYAQNYSNMSTLDQVLMDIEIESWKLYIQYQTPPRAVDQWKSVAIEELANEKEALARFQYDETYTENMTEEVKSRQYTWTKRRIRINEFALKNDTIPLSVYETMAANANTVTYSSYLLSLKNMMLVVMAVCVLLSATIMSREFTRGTIRQLLLSPYSRTTIAASKLITCLCVAAIFSVLTPVFGMIAGRLLFSNQTIGSSLSTGALPSYVSNLRNNIIEFPFHTYIFMNYALEALKIVVMIVITLMFSTITESASGPGLIMLVLSLAGAQIFQALYEYIYPAKALRYLLFGNLNLIQYIQGSWVAPYPSAITSIVVIFIVTLLALFVYFTNFRYKEISA